MAQTFQMNFKSFSVIGKVREGCKMNAHYSTKLTTNEMCSVRTYFVFFFFFFFWGLNIFFLLKWNITFMKKTFFPNQYFSNLWVITSSNIFFFFKISSRCTLMKNLKNGHMLLFTLKLSKVITCDWELLVFSTFFLMCQVLEMYVCI